MKLKPEVKVTNLTPQILLALVVAEGLYRAYIPYNYHITVTSCDDGDHGEDTWHGEGRAVDIRTKDLPASVNKKQLTQAIKDALPGYDVLFEYEGTENEHIHIEWDPDRIRG
jgi:hypothetical protein